MKTQNFWIKGYEGKYSITQFGDVYTHQDRWNELETPRRRTLVLGKNGYYVVSLYKDNKEERHYLHRLLASTFLPKEPHQDFVNHLDGVKTNNALANLEWCTQKENNQHGFRTGLNRGLIGTKPGEKCPSSKLKENDVLEIRKLFDGKNALALAKKHGVTSANIRMIINRKTWKHI